jgi:hypothetical protein
LNELSFDEDQLIEINNEKHNDESKVQLETIED